MTLKSQALDICNNFVVALDGPAASGKSTIGRMLAQKLELTYFQSGIVYRSLALSCIKQKIDLTDINRIIELSKSTEYIKNSELDSEVVGNIASQVAVIPEVRNNLGIYLVKLIKTIPRIVMEGRDIGTVVAPKADLKIFIKADIVIRAKRRYKELQKKDGECLFDVVLKQLETRDKRDIERDIAPLTISPGTLEIDTSYLSPEKVIDKIMEFILVR
ncbi:MULTISPECIES: (d)CMP kinase [Rickettsieae]|uniref:(d)CMP kinase n=1 Tax=Rickettsieae TaxID=33988 RepID=UPI000B9ACEA9|nr:MULTISPECIES: (d)CMP kinase [unclassified Rickettsia]MCC8399049.1 (d)CMP kinase [Rickettsia endosymbiont of Platyusa sonomae]OZG32377.1 cytidylate kinase [Rickettsia endosymbiont of Culicoides newsteadi]UCM85818.1 MAG: (d)CMP kinase [Rickettsia endosymbiont of Culicoides impunctatus]